MFLRLKKNFRPIAHDDYFELFDNNTLAEYQLDEEQYLLVLSLDGSRGKSEILEEYEEASRSIVVDFLDELNGLGALENLPNPKIRSFPTNVVTPYLEAVLWDTTSFCNLKCAHCYVSDYLHQSKGRDLTTEEVCKAIDEMVSMNVRDISLTGGEPLMRDDICDIIKYISDSGIRLASLFTNGIKVSREFVDFLKTSVPGKFRVRHSLDGITPQSNAVIRGDKVNAEKIFQQMVQSIKMFAEAGIVVSVGTGVHRFNVQSIPQMYSFMKELGVAEWRMAVPKPIGRFVISQDKIMAEWVDILEAYSQLIDLHLKEVEIVNGKIRAPINIEVEQVFRTELIVKTMNGFQKDDIACFYHKNRCSIKANGDITPCGYFDKVVTGNIRSDGLKLSWESPGMRQVKSLCISEVVECDDCDLLHLCGTGCRAVAKNLGGVITSKDPYACRQVEFLRNVVMPLFKKYGFTFRVSERCSEFLVVN